LDREEGRSPPCLSIWQYSVYTMEQQYTAERFVPLEKNVPELHGKIDGFLFI
jgi:hypothetical protein